MLTIILYAFCSAVQREPLSQNRVSVSFTNNKYRQNTNVSRNSKLKILFHLGNYTVQGTAIIVLTCLRDAWSLRKETWYHKEV